MAKKVAARAKRSKGPKGAESSVDWLEQIQHDLAACAAQLEGIKSTLAAKLDGIIEAIKEKRGGGA